MTAGVLGAEHHEGGGQGTERDDDGEQRHRETHRAELVEQRQGAEAQEKGGPRCCGGASHHCAPHGLHREGRALVADHSRQIRKRLGPLHLQGLRATILVGNVQGVVQGVADEIDDRNDLDQPNLPSVHDDHEKGQAADHGKRGDDHEEGDADALREHEHRNEGEEEEDHQCLNRRHNQLAFSLRFHPLLGDEVRAPGSHISASIPLVQVLVPLGLVRQRSRSA
mmetsp:Transcript_51214/g.137410  ORF Transcript_51214/g.137410 Transcript_51214/m.137410 type:complete len:224 (+) Transcript_51214:132-803(+)